MADSKTARIVQVLSAEDSPLRAEGVRLAVDHLLASRLTEVVDLAEVTTLVVNGLTEENVSRVMARHVKPGWGRYAQRADAARERVESFVPHAARTELRRVIVGAKAPPAKWAEDLVDPALLRRLLAPVWMNLLVNFGKRVLGGTTEAPGVSQGARVASSLAGRLGRSVQERAEKLVDAGRSVMGGLGAEVERRMQGVAREFADGAATLFKESLRDRLESDEGRELLAEITGGVVDRVMATPIAALQADANVLPVEAVLDTVPAIVAHARETDLVRAVVRAEVDAFVALEGSRTLAELLDETHLGEPVRAMLLERGSRIVQGLVATDAFGNWLERLLDA